SNEHTRRWTGGEYLRKLAERRLVPPVSGRPAPVSRRFDDRGAVGEAVVPALFGGAGTHGDSDCEGSDEPEHTADTGNQVQQHVGVAERGLLHTGLGPSTGPVDVQTQQFLTGRGTGGDLESEEVQEAETGAGEDGDPPGNVGGFV